MAVGNTYSFTLTTYDIITLAAKWLGKLGENETLTPSEYQDCRMFLNAMTNQWVVNNDGAAGIKTWLRKRGYLFLNSNSGSYTLSTSNTSYWTNAFSTTFSAGNNSVGQNVIYVANGSAITNANTIGIQCDDGSLFWANVTAVNANTINIDSSLIVSSNGIANYIYSFMPGTAQPPQIVETVVLRDNLGNDTTIQQLNLEDWMGLPSKQAQGYYGDPLAVYIEPHLTGSGSNAYVSLFTDVNGAQDTSKYLVLSYLQKNAVFLNPADECDFPVEYQMALVYNLAKHIAPMFNAPWTQSQEMQAVNALKYARNSRPKTSSRGFVPGVRSSGEGTVLLWR